MTAPRLRDQLCFQLYTASRLVVRAYQDVLHDLGLTYPQYLVMLVLWERDDAGEEPLSIGALGERLLLDSGTLTPLLKRMERAGLVTRVRAAHDERVVQVSLAPRGRALSERAAEVPVSLLCKYTGDPSDLAALREQVRDLVDRIRPTAATSAA